MFRPYCLHAVHGMQPTATDVARGVVCVCVCVYLSVMYVYMCVAHG